jgi:uncharacterized protein (TIGR02118 family)
VSELKSVFVLYRRPGVSTQEFFANLRDEHGPLVDRLPGLRRYFQNHVVPDPSREHPGWDAVIEFYWKDRASMEAAWASPEGRAATEHLHTLADLSRSRWSIVEEHAPPSKRRDPYLSLLAAADDLGLLRSWIIAIRNMRLYKDSALAIGMRVALLVVYWRLFNDGLPDRGRDILKQLSSQEKRLHKKLKLDRNGLAAHIGLDQRFPFREIGLVDVSNGNRRVEVVEVRLGIDVLAQLDAILNKVDEHVRQQLSLVKAAASGHETSP